MKRMFPFFAALATLIGSILPAPAFFVRAEEEPQTARYAVAVTENVWLYREKNEESGIFLLPVSYYVRILGEDEEYYEAEYFEDAAPYLAVKGYCKKADLQLVDFLPARPYLRLELAVSYVIEGAPSSAMGNGSFDRITRTFLYYGTSYLGTTRFYYVLCDGVFDYIPATQELVFERNTDYLSPPEEPPAAEKPEEAVSSLTGAHAAVLLAIGLSAAAIAIFVLRGRRNPVPDAAEF